MRSDEAAAGMIVDRERLGLPILFEGEHEFGLIKPAGMATEPTSDRKEGSLLSRVRSAVPAYVTPKLPHRLDRMTRGIVVALSNDATRFHNDPLRASAWEKIHLARLSLSGPDRAGALLGAHNVHLRTRAGRATVVRTGGRRAITEALAAAPDRDDESHALRRLRTGRYHQIRAAMAHLGVPLIDDGFYGPGPRRGGVGGSIWSTSRYDSPRTGRRIPGRSICARTRIARRLRPRGARSTAGGLGDGPCRGTLRSRRA